MTTPPREPVSDLMADIERGIADPDNQDPTVVYIRGLRTLAAEGSAGGVTATVDGYGRLKAIRLSPVAAADPSSLGRSVRRAVNLAINESERRQPPAPPYSPFSLEPYCLPPLRPPTHAHVGGVVTPEDTGRWIAACPEVDAVRRDAFIDAAHIVGERILRDARRVEDGLVDLLLTVFRHLGRPHLHAAWVRRLAGVDVSHLEWFSVEVGVSLTRYIRHRRLETAARMIYRSELSLGDIAPLFDFPDVDEFSRVLHTWSGQTPEDLRFLWEHAGLDYVLLMWAATGAATQSQADRVREDLNRMERRLDLPPLM